MTVPAWHEEPISKKHDRDVFDCGDHALNDFLRRYARKSHEAGGAKTFLAIDDADNTTPMATSNSPTCGHPNSSRQNGPIIGI